MSNENKDLDFEKKKVIIDKVVTHLSKKNIDLYYEPTINICQEVYNTIKNDEVLNHQEKELVDDLEPQDIQILLSYSSNCC